MTQYIGGPGVPLPYPQNLYPSELYNAPADAPTNLLTLSGGDTLTIPAGRWLVGVGGVSVMQFLDPVTGVWRGTDPTRVSPQYMLSDGFTRRVANLTGCPVAAIVAGGGSGFAQATATLTSNVGGSTWQAIVGGALSVSTIAAAGKNYTLAPEVFIPAPPVGGVQATAYAALTSGSVTTVSLTNFGAGYTSAPVAVILPSPVDPNAGTITQATVTLILDAGKSTAITGGLCTYNGAPLATISALTLTAAGGAGTGATITPVVMQTVTSATATAGGAGWGNAAAPAGVTTTGGQPTTASVNANPAIEMTGFRPRQAQISVTCNAGGTISAPVVMDGGLFAAAPSAVIITGGALPTTLASITLALGTATDTVLLQPL